MPGVGSEDRGASVFDAVVVGTGFGGAVTALRLCEAGLRVCVLERGRRFEGDDFPDMPTPEAPMPDGARLLWPRDQGMWDVQDLDQVLSIQVAGYGGGSLGYAGVHLVPPAEAFEGWPLEREALLPYYALARHMLSLETVEDLPRGGADRITKATRFRAAAAKLGRDADTFHPPLAIRLGGREQVAPGAPVVNPVSGRSQRSCIHCGACVSGCKVGAKNSLDHNYLALVEDSGRADLRTLAELIELHPRPGEGGAPAWRVVYRDHHFGGTRRELEAARVFLCAGAVNSTRLLLRNRSRIERSGRLGAALGRRYFPNADALGVVFDTRERHNPGHGPTITSAMVARVPRVGAPATEVEGRPLRFSWEADDDESGGPATPSCGEDWIMLQDGGYDPALQPFIAMLRAPLLMARNRHDDVGHFRDLDPPHVGATRREARARRDRLDPRSSYPRRRDPSPRDPFRDPLLASLLGLLREGIAAYLPPQLAAELPAQLEERFRLRLELPALRRVAEDTQAIAVARDLLRRAGLSVVGEDGQRSLSERGRRVYARRRWALARLGAGFGLDPDALARAALARARHELGTDEVAALVTGWIAYLSNYGHAATSPRKRFPWSPGAPNTFGGEPRDDAGEYVHMLLGMGRDTHPWVLEWRPPLAEVEARARAEQLDALARAERWSPETLSRWLDTALRDPKISHAPGEDTPHDTREEREWLDDQGVLEARPPAGARTTHTRGIAAAMPVYTAQERLMRDMARAMGGELRTNPRWAFAGQVVTVHSQGGCAIAPEGSEDAVCDLYGRVRGCEGLYVQDASLFPAPVGANPSHTVLALVERNLEVIRREDLGQSREAARAGEWADAQAHATTIVSGSPSPPWTTPDPQPRPPDAAPVGIRFRERLSGAVAAWPPPASATGGGVPEVGARGPTPWFKDSYLEAESRGRHEGALLELALQLTIADVASFVEAAEHEAAISGRVRLRSSHLLGDEALHEGRCVGAIRVLPESDQRRTGLESMRYALHLEVAGRELELLGKKVILDDPGPDLWTDTTALFVRVRPRVPAASPARGEARELRGVLRLGLTDFVRDMVRGLEVTGSEDPARILWATTSFLFFFGAGLQRAYMPQARRFLERLVRNELGIR